MEHYKFSQNSQCEYFPCHETKDKEKFNCLFCYCPLYHLENCPGNHYYKEKNGKVLKVCTDCTFPHKPENYEKIISFLKF